MIKTGSEINKISTNQGLLSQLENIILPSQEKTIKSTLTQDMLAINEEGTRNNNSESAQWSVPLIKIDTNSNLKPNSKLAFENRRDSDQELANILANVVFKDSAKESSKSPNKDQSLSEIMKDVDKIIEDTKDLWSPNTKINTNTNNPTPLVKQSTFLDKILKFNVNLFSKHYRKRQ